MSPWNLILLSLLLVLVPPVLTAPVEEREEAELTEEVEGEQSEEDEDDDDSTKEGPPGAHQTAGGASGIRPHVSSIVHVSGWQEAVAGGRSDGTTGVSGGTMEPHVHQFLLDLLGGAETSDADIAGHTTDPTMIDSTGSLINSDVISQWKGHQSLSSPVSDHTHSSTRQESSSSSSHTEQAGSEWFHTNGYGRQTQLKDMDGVTTRLASLRDLHTHSLPWAPTAGTMELATHFHSDSTVTGSSPVVMHTEPADRDLTHPLHSGTQTWHADTVTRATATMFSEATGTPLHSSAAQVTGDFHKAGSVTEQYNPSGQGPEASENVELEDTC
ncbi:uncharacterized protein si:ch211-80h18.1 isoform X2 [Dunckerocampus dactyliophorus]|uniref:uncharacterized protein si:ch211-80h18.1 isoform X2 n=1 Tax=Dunckerocampus dactyliophorus TaxID=161453 RepID=UPI0024070BB4|nr:uncharacterized protein si:ch211-80h18.1 isoform X2 [Dunckerocampus dactyliophorus]